jgi:hypothetical protein
MAVTWRQFAFAYKVASKTTAAWSKTIGATGDYATWAAMIAAMSDLIAHVVTVTIKAGTTLTEICDLKNKHGLTVDGAITIQAEKYFPTSGAIPTADSATATTLRDAALATAALGNDYFNGCWIFIVDGTGTDNGFVLITDYVDATGDVVVASWPGTQPDNTSRYLIVGAMIDGGAAREYCMDMQNNMVPLILYGIGFKNPTAKNVYSRRNFDLSAYYCGAHNGTAGFYYRECLYGMVKYCGIVDAVTGIDMGAVATAHVQYSGISDNNSKGIGSIYGAYVQVYNNFGDNNGNWGTYPTFSGQVRCIGTECSGASGNHSDPGTAGNANADQAAAY